MRKLLLGILVLGGCLVTNERAAAQCCCLRMHRLIQPRLPMLIPMTPSFPSLLTYPYPTPVYPTAAYSSIPGTIASPAVPLRMAVPRTTTPQTPTARTAITREGRTLVRNSDELEAKAKELFQRGITAEQEGNSFYAGTCYYQVFTSYSETSVASRARSAYTRIEAELERLPRSR